MVNLELQNIKNIVFDLGVVLLDLDIEASTKAFQSLGLNQNIMSNEHIFSHKFFSKFQNGELSVDEFYSCLRKALNNQNLSDKELKDTWNMMVKTIPINRVEILKKLKENYQLFLFSNTNSLHVEKIEKEFLENSGFSFQSLFVKVYYSHEILTSKPKVSSYLKVLKDAGINAHESLFIDDLKKNIVGAQMAGMQSFWLQPGMNISQIFGNAVKAI